MTRVAEYYLYKGDRHRADAIQRVQQATRQINAAGADRDN